MPIDLTAEAYAPLIARVIDRVFSDFMAAVRERGGRDLAGRYGGPPDVGFSGDTNS